jgi:putative ATP-binding cassette transporter
VFLITSIPIGIYYYQKTDNELEKMEDCEEHFIQHFEAILAGFKELKINHQERDELLLQIEKLSKSSRDRRINANNHLMNEGILSHITMYSLILVTIFIIPQIVPETTENIYKITAIILFILGPAALLAAALPGLSRTIHIINNLYRLEERLDNTNKNILSSSNTQNQYTRFKQISLTDIEFTYRDKADKELFHSGAFNLNIHAGELLFIVGGNGSGKSTFLKLLTGLYQPDKGILSLDNQPISRKNCASYQSLFSIVFTDFHLFDQLYGLPNISDDEVNTWIKKLALDHKTTFKDGRFTNIDLSTGQRKRLAFISAVLKNRPICIFDELAADQDPQFRRQFYEKILPELKAEGRTVIVVTHDDTYFKQSDRLIKLADGKIIFDSLRAVAAPHRQP